MGLPQGGGLGRVCTWAPASPGQHGFCSEAPAPGAQLTEDWTWGPVTPRTVSPSSDHTHISRPSEPRPPGKVTAKAPLPGSSVEE